MTCLFGTCHLHNLTASSLLSSSWEAFGPEGSLLPVQMNESQTCSVRAKEVPCYCHRHEVLL